MSSIASFGSIRISMPLAGVFVAWLGAGCAKVEGGNSTGGGGINGGGTGAARGTIDTDDAGIGGPRGTTGGPIGPGGCRNLQCQQVVCDNGGQTTVSGKVYDPAGKVPIYNVIVYVPNEDLAPLKEGVSCETCDGTATGAPVAATLTDATGSFVLSKVPVGSNIPLVMQIGKWRRQVTIPKVASCTDNPITNVDLTRLPRNKDEGHLPQIALSTGHADALDCFLRQVGIADSEFTNDSGNGRVHLYAGGAGNSSNQGAIKLASGATFSDAYTTLFADYNKLTRYDVVMLQCESAQLDSEKQPYVGNMKRYADNGGRLFAEHLHSVFFRLGPAPWPSTGNWLGGGAADLTPPVTGLIDTSFPKGMALASWLVAVNASPTLGQIPLDMAQHSLDAPAGTNQAFGTQRWIYTSAPMPSIQYLTFNTPVEEVPANQCGRAVFTDVHAGNGAGVSHPEIAFPTGCSSSTDLSPQAKALEFMLFDLSSCILPEREMPKPPVIE